MEENIFYNYVYLDPRKPGDYNYGEFHFDYEPFEIGKGKGNRLYAHLYEKEETTYNPHKVRILNKIKKAGLEPIIFKIFENLDEITAYGNEVMLIELIGRHNQKTGPLTNITGGGTGGDTLSNHPNKKDIYNRISMANRGQKRSDEFCLKQKKRIENLSDDEKKKWYKNLSESLKGLKKSDEHVEKLREYCGEKHWHYGQKESEEMCKLKSDRAKKQFENGMPLETRQKLSEYRGEKNSQYGKPKSKETREKMSKSSICMKYFFETPTNEIIEIISYKGVIDFFGNDSILYKDSHKNYKFIKKEKLEK